MTIRAFIFDFDGTIVASNGVKRSGFFFVSQGIEGAAEKLRRLLAEPDPGDRYDIFRKLGADHELLVEAYGRYCEREILALLKTTPVAPLLEGLKRRGYALFIASATPQLDLVAMMAKSPLAQVFDEIHGRPRSKTEIIDDICQRRGYSPHEVVMVGDDAPDARAAEEYGCRFIAVGENPDCLAAVTEFLQGHG